MPHSIPIPLNYGKGTVGFFTDILIPESLIIFVHGFGGRSISSWDNFPELLRNNPDPKVRNADIVFYGYNSIQGQAYPQAAQFYTFLRRIDDPAGNRFGFRRRYLNDDFRYSNIILVAHSLGAIIVRRALISAYNDGKGWVPFCKMVLFAPAHMGALSIPSLIFECIPVAGKAILGLTSFFIPVLNDLKVNSLAIQRLINDTQNLINNNQRDGIIAHSIVWGHNDNIVSNLPFCSDPNPIDILNKGHISVCKPIENTYIDPVDVLINAI